MIEVTAQFYEAGHECVQFRLYAPDGSAVEPVLRIPMQTWRQLPDAGREAIIRDGLAYTRQLYPHLSEDKPSGGRATDRSASEGTAGDGPGHHRSA